MKKNWYIISNRDGEEYIHQELGTNYAKARKTFLKDYVGENEWDGNTFNLGDGNYYRLDYRIPLRDQELVSALQNFVEDCDVDELCDLLSRAFGGTYEYDTEGQYYLIVDKDYGGQFGHLPEWKG